MNSAAAERDIINPATGEVIATVPEQFGNDVDIAVGKAQRAFDSGPWPQMPRTARARALLRIADAIEEGSEQLYQLEARNNGRPITETRAQLSRVAEWFRYNAGLLAAQRPAVLPGDGPYLTYQQRLPTPAATNTAAISTTECGSPSTSLRRCATAGPNNCRSFSGSLRPTGWLATLMTPDKGGLLRT